MVGLSHSSDTGRIKVCRDGIWIFTFSFFGSKGKREGRKELRSIGKLKGTESKFQNLIICKL